MPLDPESVPRQGLVSLQSCLVEGDPEQRARERRVRRKALVSSVFLQASFLAALILVPLFAKPAHLDRTIVTPVPPYRNIADRVDNIRRPDPGIRRVCVVCPHRDRPTILHQTHIDPAMLIHRVEPVYPTLARQTRRSGRVELRAVIATDGTIQSLQVVSGDPLFYQSAMDAVRQWRYRPTVLNGEPVEIDTFISVIYNLGG